MNRFSYAALTAAVLFAALGVHAEVRKIVHPDGRVEYTNVAPTQKASVVSTYYKYRNADGSLAFSDEKPGSGVEYERVRFDCYACQVNSGVNWETTPLFMERYQQSIDRIAGLHGVDKALVRAVIHAESAFNPQARSRVGAQGLMQLMPQTAAELGVGNPFDVDQNIDGGVRYLAMLLKRYDHDVRLATAAYNAGPGAVQEYGGVPPYAETRAYVKRIAILQRRYAAAL
ncbi:lytic transglycosylase domain-containing protein [Marinobacterium weihaiense]|uniref:Lytic transglycosylase domain-containing protein n=1 Tax=Marinobacterium weihaiense TaxID=2851016 RepID=A0ABS6M992_9GAMM|nr:lytic transglycosylase domain-containing protein [Marinobacterium weihaiense]MBV0932847.1 lytic transglycosylase domain-containing protein [Marinobacterium weihaiense]